MNSWIGFNKPFMVGKELFYIAQSVLAGQLAGDGAFTKRCHALLEQKLGCARAFLTHSCTAALEMAALLAEVGPGDEVILPSFTFVSTANAFCLRGAKPVFVDIDARTLNISAENIRRALTPRTRIIVPVHYAGVPCDMDAIMAIARTGNILVVEDAAQAFGACYNSRPLGTIGDLGTLSFHETKNIISGEGGALIVNNPSFIERAEVIREKGTNRSRFFRGQVDKYTWIDIGSSYLPSELVAAFLCAQLEQADAINQKRRQLYANYMRLLEPLSRKYGFRLPEVESGNGHLFYILAGTLEERDALIAYLKAQGIQSIFHYVPLHSSPMGLRLASGSAPLPVTENISSRLLRLPMYYELTLQIQERVARQVGGYYENAGMAH